MNDEYNLLVDDLARLPARMMAGALTGLHERLVTAQEVLTLDVATLHDVFVERGVYAAQAAYEASFVKWPGDT